MTTLLHRNIQSPTAMELSCWSRFTGCDEVNLCVAKANVLEIYSIVKTTIEPEDSDEDDSNEDTDADATPSTKEETNTSLRIVARYPLFGRIETMVSNYKAKRACIAYMEKHCRLTFLYLLPPSNLFHCLCHVSPLYLKQPKQVIFFNPIKYIYFEHLFTTLY